MNFWDWLFGKKKNKKEKDVIPMSIKDKLYWETKHPFAKQMYSGRPLPNNKSYDIDVRHFIWNNDVTLQSVLESGFLIQGNLDDTVGGIQKFICKLLEYTPDTKLGASEYWLFPAETFNMKKGDCEDGAILMASLILNAIPADEHWRVRVNVGWVHEPDSINHYGHAYVVYCRATDNEWVILDWCFLADPTVAIKDKPLAKNVKDYEEIWFSFNHLHSWAYRNVEVSYRVREY